MCSFSFLFSELDQMLSFCTMTKEETAYFSFPKICTKGLCRKHLMFCSGWPNQTNHKAFPTINLQHPPQSVSYVELTWSLRSTSG